MPQIFEELTKREFFYPSYKAVFINPFFFIKRGVFKGIKANAKYLSGVMLDFGCGSKPYRNLFNVQCYIGLDMELSGHDHQDSNIDLFYDGKRIPFADSTFNSVLAAEVFEHVFNIDQVLDELYRVMKLDGQILITIPFGFQEHEIPNDYARYTSFGIKYLLESKGFQIIKFEKTGNYVETIFQGWNAYLSQYVLPSNKYLKIILILLTITPVTLVGLVFSRILPENNNFYLNNIILAKKIRLSEFSFA